MPNIFKTLVIRRFLAHSLEIGTTFAITLILLNILNYINGFMLGYGNFVEIISSNTPNLGVYNSASFTDQSVTAINQLIMGFALFYFIYAAFNFFFTFSFLYPKNNFQANFFQRLFGFKKFDFGKKKMTHLEKALRMLLRETVLFFSIYGFFMILSILKLRDLFDLFNYITQSEISLLSIPASLIALFTIFVLPSFLLSMFSLKISKGKQLFWDWASSITLK